jgi:hypothetical protein
VWVQSLRIPERRVWGRSAEIDLRRVQIRLHLDHDLIQRSFHPDGAGYRPPEVITGQSLPDWLETQAEGEARPLLACNALHTNFVRGNGFVVIDQELICKPPGTIPLDGETHQPLQGAYTALVLMPEGARVSKLKVHQGKALDWVGCDLAISGPQIVRQGQNVVSEVPVRLPGQGQTLGDEINFPVDDPTARTSFTALGVNFAGRLLAVSVFAGQPSRVARQRGQIVFRPAAGDGLTLREMADLMIHLGAQEAILGGGSGDAQQAIRGQPTWCALPRPQAGRVQTTGSLRGLGAILAIYSALT